ncbi:MAG: AmmeMemoRadiSam system radical SAM enzyme [Candidatus Micrarchaeota archaeon]
MKEAMLYGKIGDGNVRCALCNHRCVIASGKRGFCGVRENIDGALYSLVYSRACSYAIDKIEKKPFFHFFPGTDSFSFSTVGCNFRCLHCQNFEISQAKSIFGEDLPPSEIVRMALAGRCQGIAYTYTEPTVFFEYCHDTARIARDSGLYNVFVTNGYMTPEAIKEMGDIHASRIDLKSMSDKFYREICSARLEPVLNSIKLLHKKGHIELINLVIPTKNDSDDEIRALAGWVRALDRDVPLHFTAYYPANKMTIHGTPVETLERARKLAMEEGIHYVYLGNVPGHPGENTYCHNCGELLIERYGFSITKNKLAEKHTCPNCGTGIRVFDRTNFKI